jgi:hypothetical protein
MAWTDERLDDLANRMDAGFARVDRDIHALRLEVKADIRDLRTELKGDIAASRTELKGEIDRLHALIVRFGVAILICLVTVIAALIGVIPGGPAGG